MKTAICGLWHVHAEGYYQVAYEHSDVIGVWEENEQRRKEFCEKYELAEFQTLEELLNSDAENVILCTSTDTHADIIVRLAEAGKNIFTEKVLALTDEDCERAAAAIEKNGVNFVISLVQKYMPGPLTVKQIMDNGELGKINYMRFRNCHSGSVANWLPPHFYDLKQCGGGAMIDLGAHGMYLTDWLCGVPDTYASVFTCSCSSEAAAKINSDRVEDNAVTVMGYANGCIAVNETGFVSVGCPMTLELGGETGYVYMNDRGVFKCTQATKNVQTQVALAETLPSPLEQFLSGKILEGCGIEEAKRLTHMMVRAYQTNK